MNSNFDKYASYYNLLYKDKDYAAEVNYIADLIEKYKTGTVNSILNLGCGTGNHDFLLAKKGFHITGVDQSAEMIKIANNKAEDNEHVKFFCGDIRSIDLNQKFDVIVSLFHVMSYQVTNEDLQATMETVKKHLASEGIFIFDCWHGPAVLTEKPSVKIKRMSSNELNIIRIAEPEIFYDKNMVNVHYEIFSLSDEPANFTRFEETHKMRYFFKPEIELFASKSNLKMLADFNWMEHVLPTEKSWSVVYILKH